MNKYIRNCNSLISLLTVGLLSAAIWWKEVQLRGWDGLQWAGYFHLAVPVGATLFLAWLSFHCAISTIAKRVVYLILVTAFIAGAYLVAEWSLCWHFGAHQVWMPFNEWPFVLKLSLFSIYFTFPAIPILLFCLSWCFGIKFQKIGLAVGLITYGLAVPAAILIIYLVNHRGYPDSIHAIKTGFCIPFLMVGLGLPFVFQKRNAIQQNDGQISSESALPDELSS